MFAEVSIPVHVRQTFTYGLPPDIAERAQAGSRVIVPFGNKLVTGFIVSLHDQVDDQILASVKNVEELVDDDPIIGRDILDLTRWMADYYYAPWGECLRAALPAGSLSVAEQIFQITEGGRAAFNSGQPGRSKPSSQTRALDLLAGAGRMSNRELERELARSGTNPGSVSALLRRLERAGYISRSQRIAESRLRPKLQNFVKLRAAGTTTGDHLAPESPDAEPAGGDLTKQQRRVIDALATEGDAIPLGRLLEKAEVSVSVVRGLEKRGVVEVVAREVRRDPLEHLSSEPVLDLVTLSSDQNAALDEIVKKIEAREYATFLLHGVTGSGKTEIYIRAMKEAVRGGRTALMLIPEISLTPVFSRRLRAHFGESVAILHSSLSEGERVDEWRRIKQGDARVVIGTRSAVFAPLESLGVVIVDEEHDTSYKQDESPRYNGRDTAIMRAVAAGAVVVLGSATPSLESYHNAHAGKYIYIRLQTRYGERKLADVETIDMREVFKRHGKQQTFSDELLSAVAETHSRGEQCMILLNRRGFSSYLLCRSCGLAIHCPNCDVTLTYHRYNHSLQCHYCNYIRPVPQNCPACDGVYVHYVGEGTEQIEAKLQGLFPTMKIARLDRDTTRRRGSYEHILMEFADGSIDLLVGTQMIAKGHDFPNVTLVGVISVDTGLAMPDFRSAERTFQLLTQVAGRAGRGDRPGRVIIQTYHPQHYSLVCAQAQDYEGFYEREINYRSSMHYPPFRALINICAHHKDFETAGNAAACLARELREAADGQLRVLGPAPAPLARLRGEYRFQVLIKTANRRTAREALDLAMDRALAAGYKSQSISIEVDPINLM
jgi:primosomal protein N' (replication factor Y)